jgi:type IV pilus assembly protein PilF
VRILRLNLALWACVLLAGCKHGPTEKQQQASQIHYDLGIQAQQSGEAQEAYMEFQESLKLDPKFPEAHNAIAILLHVVFKRPEEAIPHYRQALELKPTFSEVKTNLANVYLDLGRWDEAIELYEQALNDMLYATPYIAQSNLGWALYKKGNVTKGIESLRAAVTTNPKFCLGYRNLGIIYEERGQLPEACLQFSHYRENCPEVADAYFREGMCLAKTGKTTEALERFTTCQSKASSTTLKDDCKLYADKLR